VAAFEIGAVFGLTGTWRLFGVKSRVSVAFFALFVQSGVEPDVDFLCL